MSRRDMRFIEKTKPGAGRRSRRACVVLVFCCAMFVLMLGMLRVQRVEWLDVRVTQVIIVDTICVSGYVDRVLLSFEIQMHQKERLLKQWSIDASFASEYAFDHCMLVLLGGLSNSFVNLDLCCWEGRVGQWRKERLAVYLKCCVCIGDIMLKSVQSAMVGDWPNRYPNLLSMTCNGF